MRRVISIFLATLVLLIVVRPTLAFHYCGDRLRYVKILAEIPVNSCCSVADGSAGKYAEEREFIANEYLLSESAKSCCSSYVIGISTDDFNLQQESKLAGSSVVVNHLPIFNSLSFVPDDYVDPAAINLLRFLPGDTFYESRELLSLICTFLI